ncbi:MAG: HAMP domain-containing sensor histidine kinase, partial [Bacteroidota bacterium]
MPTDQIGFSTKFCEVLDSISGGDLDHAEKLIEQFSDDPASEANCGNIAKKLRDLISHLRDGAKFASALSAGDLQFEAPRNFYLFSDYKQLQSNLRHLTWQAQQIAKGDYSQNVKFIGELSDAFNQMIEGLRTAKRTQEQLKELYTTRDKFFSIISHDLRSPFNAILGFSDILTEEWDELTEIEQKNFLNNIRNTAHQTFELLERLLEWSRVQTGKMRFVQSRINIAQIVEENFRLLKASADRKYIRLVSEVPEDSFAWADKDAILLILRNLINN